MTHSPPSGPTAPRTTDFGASAGSGGSTTTHQRSADDTSETPPVNPWGPGNAAAAAASDSEASGGRGGSAQRAQDPAFGAPVHADAPTGTMPALVTGNATSSTTSGAGSSAGAPSGVGAVASAPTTQTPPARPQTPARPPASAPAQRGGQARTSSRSARSRGPRRARLQLRNINPWTVLKFSCVLSIALFFVWLIVVGVLFGILDAAGIIGKVNDTIVTLNGPDSEAPITAGVVFGGAAIIGVVNIVLFIALSTVGSIVYNLCADLVGGIEVTLSER